MYLNTGYVWKKGPVMKGKIKNASLHVQKLTELFKSSVHPAVIFSDIYIKSSFISALHLTAT